MSGSGFVGVFKIVDGNSLGCVTCGSTLVGTIWKTLTPPRVCVLEIVYSMGLVC